MTLETELLTEHNFGKCVTQYHEQLVRLVRKGTSLKDSHALQDLLQDTYLALFEHISLPGHPGVRATKFVPYAATVAIRTHIDNLRKTRRKFPHPEGYILSPGTLEQNTPDDDLQPIDKLIGEETNATLHQRINTSTQSLLDSLPQNHATIYRLRQTGKTYDAIAEQLATSPKTVGTALRRTRIKLARTLASLLDELIAEGYSLTSLAKNLDIPEQIISQTVEFYPSNGH